MAFPIAESFFVNQLSNCDLATRRRAFTKLRKYILRRSRAKKSFSKDDLALLWRGLHYCMWLQDIPVNQEVLADQLCALVDCLVTDKEKLNFFITFFHELANQWYALDQWRMNKYMMLTRRMLRAILKFLRDCQWKKSTVQEVVMMFKKSVFTSSSDAYPDGIKIHFASIYLDELDSASDENMSSQVVNQLILPYCTLIGCKISESFFKVLKREIFDALLLDVDQNESSEGKAHLQFDFGKIADQLFNIGKRMANDNRRAVVYKLVERFRLVVNNVNPNEKKVENILLDDLRSLDANELRQATLQMVKLNASKQKPITAKSRKSKKKT